MAREQLGLLQGTVDVLILRTLAWAPMHGYGISQWIAQRSAGQLAVEDAATIVGNDGALVTCIAALGRQADDVTR